MERLTFALATGERESKNETTESAKSKIECQVSRSKHGAAYLTVDLRSKK